NETLISLSSTKVINLKELEQHMKVELVEVDHFLWKWLFCEKWDSNSLGSSLARIENVHHPFWNIAIQTIKLEGPVGIVQTVSQAVMHLSIIVLILPKK